MSQENTKMEDAVRLTEELITEIARYRDLGKNYKEAAESLSQINEHLGGIADNYAAMEVERLDGALTTLTSTLDEMKTKAKKRFRLIVTAIAIVGLIATASLILKFVPPVT